MALTAGFRAVGRMMMGTSARLVPQGTRMLTTSAVLGKSQNPNLATLGGDYLYHLGFASGVDESGKEQLEELFSDVKFFFCGGSADRMAEYANRVAANFVGTKYEVPFGQAPVPIGKQERYSIFKVGPTLISSHGMGQPSISILLHEVTKMLEYAKATDVEYFRLGSSGGIGIAPGSVVVTSGGLNGELKPVYTLPILGKLVDRPAVIDPSLVADLVAAAEKRIDGYDVIPGKTMSTDCFYEGQGRLDGAICDYTIEDKMEFLNKLHSMGARNIEMEAAQFAAFTHRLGIRGTGLCTTLLNRLDGDQVLTPLEELASFDQRPGEVAMAYMNERLGL